MIFEKLKEILCEELQLEEDMVNPETDFIMDLDFDSLDIVDFQMSIEDILNFEFPFDEDVIEIFKKVKTVGGLADYIEKNK